ncbi:hypothetical protein E1200_09190 [Actinomadura sp. GC306]|uniref:transposase n=1 Tax=Actinomadura sp. GC306 TaxID=2530367 RepID=UPI00105052FD|nr:transposase [Actinomadura sp. GC306]TDC69187.1 hypothetical protein E1200_09190 [Actinomadura sp. GC306]
MAAPGKYPKEVRDRVVRLSLESDRSTAQIAADLSIHREALCTWGREAETDVGQRSEQLTTAEREDLKRLREGKQRAKSEPRYLEGRVQAFRRRAWPAPDEVVAVLDHLRDRFGARAGASGSEPVPGYLLRPKALATVCPRAARRARPMLDPVLRSLDGVSERKERVAWDG